MNISVSVFLPHNINMYGIKWYMCVHVYRQIEVQIDRNSWMFREIGIDRYLDIQRDRQVQVIGCLDRYGYIWRVGGLERKISRYRHLTIQRDRYRYIDSWMFREREINQGKTREGKCVFRTVTDSSILSEGLGKRYFRFGFRILGKMELIVLQMDSS